MTPVKFAGCVIGYSDQDHRGCATVVDDLSVAHTVHLCIQRQTLHGQYRGMEFTDVTPLYHANPELVERLREMVDRHLAAAREAGAEEVRDGFRLLMHIPELAD